MKIDEFIRESVLRPRLVSAECLVVYDAERRYRELCGELADDRIRVVDATKGSIEGREAALKALREIGRAQPAVEGLLIYVPTRRPETDLDRQGDPFAPFAVCGAVFPRDDGDDYLSLCLRAKPDHAADVRKVFAANSEGPPFAVIDAIGSGGQWPQLRALLRVQSAREILLALMVPTGSQIEALKGDETWVQEAKEFLKVALGLALKTRGKSWNSVADELWRYVLFSEFAFDLPGGLPESLRAVPHAPVEARLTVEDVCEQLRGMVRTAGDYVERAETIERELDLTARCATIDELGERDTFPFEERAYLQTASQALRKDDLESARFILGRRKSSIWRRRGEAQAQWDLVSAALAVCEACDDLERQLPEHSRSQAALLDFYVRQLREADRLQREFEQAVGTSVDAPAALDALINHARARYRQLAERVQTVFMKHLENDGWPPYGRLANASVFDRLVADRLNERDRRIAYLMVDALRYELGLELERLLAEDGPVELHVAFAQLPSITPVGMVSLLPGAQTKLQFRVEQDALQPMLDGVAIRDVRQRMDVLAKRYGDRFKEMAISQFLRTRADIPTTVDLLVLRSTEIDSQLENNPESTLRLIPDTLRSIRSTLHKLRGLGFKEAVIVTDHGFFLNAQADLGDVCSRPPGVWAVNAHDRMLLGEGVSDMHSIVVGASKVGISGEIGKVAMPRTMAPYRAGHLYFHGGASLAEAVVPVLVAKLKPLESGTTRKITFELSYKGGAVRITTRLPMIDLYWPATDDMFAAGAARDVLLEAVDKDGNVIGEPRPGGDINPATHTVTLGPGQRRQIILKMEPSFEGAFTVKALDPTTSATYASLNLQTDYTV